MKFSLTIIALSISIISFAQKISKESAIQLYVLALQDFQKVPLEIHDLDKNILVAKPDCEINELPKKIGSSNVQWVCLGTEFFESIKKKASKNSGRSIILISYKQTATDTIKVRIDQWTLENLEKGFSFKPIDVDVFKEYRIKNHDYIFSKLNDEWTLQTKANDISPISDFDKQTESLFQKGVKLDRQGNTKEALHYVELSMSRDSSMYQRYMFRSGLKVKLGMYESAIDDMSKCIQKCDCRTRKSHVSTYLMERSKIHFLNGNYDSTLSDINQSLGLTNNSWNSFALRGKMHYNEKNYDQAMADLNQSIELNMDEASLYLLRGLLHSEMGNDQLACSDLYIASEKGSKEAKSWIEKKCK